MAEECDKTVIVTAGGSIITGFKGPVPTGARVYATVEAAQAACDHDWIEHFSPYGPTHQMCLKCGKEERFDAYKIAKPTAFEESTKKQTSSAGRWAGKSVVYGKEDEANTPYMTRYWIGRLRLHVFHRGDQDPDPHDHPWDFWTFPLVPYVEEIVLPNRYEGGYERHRQLVPAFRWSFRPAEHTHRVIGRAVEITEPCDDATICYHNDRAYGARPGPIYTLVWRSEDKRAWGFLKDRDGKWCWIGWREYVFGGGKSAPCE